MNIPANSNTTIQNEVPKTDVFILVGGRSSRLGRDKALVKVNGRTLAGRAVDVARAALPESKITMVAGSEEQFAINALAAATPFVFDLYQDRGPLGGLHAALSYAGTPWIFVLACDYPFISIELITLLADKILDQYGVVVPRQPDDRIQPLCAYYNVEACRPAIEGLLRGGGRPAALHQLIGQLSPRIVQYDEYRHIPNAENAFLNINTASDLDSINSGFEEAD